MSKTEKNNHGKVPKITEEEYTAYVNRLRELSEGEGHDGGGAKTTLEEGENSIK